MVDADIGALYAREEAFDLVGIGAILGLIGLGVIDTLQFVQANQVVIALMLVGEHLGVPQDVIPGGRPCGIAVFVIDDAGEGLTRTTKTSLPKG